MIHALLVYVFRFNGDKEIIYFNYISNHSIHHLEALNKVRSTPYHITEKPSEHLAMVEKKTTS